MFKWYVIQVMSGQEKKVKKALEENLEKSGMKEQIIEVLVPTENVSEVKKGQHRITEKKIWPGYILIKMHFTEESWAYVKDTSGVLDFLGGEKPTSLSDNEVANILQELEEKKKGVVQKHKIEIGDTVKITEGVFVNFLGTVVEVFHDKGRLSVLVSIFGRDTRVDDLEFWQVEKVSQE
ncbi:MAG: transcription termination/antitermination protein NusG [Chlamydiae bacterium]|nr:transcription termination/antitermination protein NusG [Chlamydiota bacterium]